jgi:hypothetical protein
MELLITWMLAFMVSVAPPGRKNYYVEAQETKAEAMVRYKSITEDIIEVVYDPNMKPLFKGDSGRTRTAGMILSIMLYESGFGRNVDFGVGKYARGDNGRSWCLMQLNIGKGRPWVGVGGWNVKRDRPKRYGDNPKDLVLGSTGPEMVKDRRKCVLEGLRLAKLSFQACRRLPLSQRLRAYMSGRCTAGAKGSAARVNTAVRYYTQTSKERKKFKDSDIVKLVKAKLKKRKPPKKVKKPVARNERKSSTYRDPPR